MSLMNYSPTVCEVSVKLKFHPVTDGTKNCSNWNFKDYRRGCLKTQITFLTIQHRAEPLALFLLQENPIKVGYLKQPANWLQVSHAIARVWRRWPQPCPQGVFPWLWEKCPGDEVALTPERCSALSWCTLSNDLDEQKESDHKKELNNKPTERSRNSNFFSEAPIDFSRSPSLPFFPFHIAWLIDNRNAGLPISYSIARSNKTASYAG